MTDADLLDALKRLASAEAFSLEGWGERLDRDPELIACADFARQIVTECETERH